MKKTLLLIIYSLFMGFALNAQSTVLKPSGPSADPQKKIFFS